MSEILLTFTTDPDALSATTLPLGQGSPKLVPGNLGWAEVGRPKQTSFLDWEGRELRRQEIPIIFDRIKTGQSVQPEIDALEQLARPSAGKPPAIRIAGPVHHTDLVWAIESFDLEDDAHRYGGAIVQQTAKLVLVEHEAPDVAVVKVTRKRTHKVKSGEKISKIAAHYLGNAKRWPEIVELNKSKIKNPKRLKAGITLVIPDR